MATHSDAETAETNTYAEDAEPDPIATSTGMFMEQISAASITKNSGKK